MTLWDDVLKWQRGQHQTHWKSTLWNIYWTCGLTECGCVTTKYFEGFWFKDCDWRSDEREKRSQDGAVAGCGQGMQQEGVTRTDFLLILA
jgi:hypothetical protein